MFKTILTAYDDSGPAAAAVEFSGRLAAMSGARLVIAHTVAPLREDGSARDPSDEITDVTRQECREWRHRLDEALVKARDAAAAVDAAEDLNVEGRVVIGKAGPGLIELREELAADLLVAGTHGVGHVKQKVFGSVSQHLLEHSPAELLFIRESVPPEPPTSVVVGLDGSDWSKRALAVGESLAMAFGGPLVLTHVAGYPAPFADSAYLSGKEKSSLRDELHEHGEAELEGLRESVDPAIENVIEDPREGHVREEMLAACEERFPSVAVVGTRGAGGISGILVGSVTRELLDHSRSPVLVVRLPKDTAETS